jgi:hypothetical protein
MKSFQREEGLSEVIGFILLVGLLVVFLALYQTYSVPVQGRDNEIDHMNDVKDTLVAYKISLDSLWVNERKGTTLSTTLDLGTRGGFSQGGMGDIALLTPISSGGSVGIYQRTNERIIVTGKKKGGQYIPRLDYNPGLLEFKSSNNYWIDQTYYYQLGGVFLEQDSGSTVRVMPPLTIESFGDGALAQIDFTIIGLNDKHFVSGTGPVRIDTNLNHDGLPHLPEYNYLEMENITITFHSDNHNSVLMWKKLFEDSLVDKSFPDGQCTVTQNPDKEVSLNIVSDPPNFRVDANIIQANYTAKLQTVATKIT